MTRVLAKFSLLLIFLIGAFTTIDVATGGQLRSWIDLKFDGRHQDSPSARGASSVQREAPIQAEIEAVVEELLSRQRLYALVIGNSAYEGGFNPLDGVAEDLKVVPETLQNAGFSVTVKRDLDSNTLEPAVRSFFNEFGSDPDNELLVYFASHGATDDLGTGYIVPIDAPQYSHDPVGFRRKSMSMNILQAIAKDSISKHVMFVFDSCFAGTIFEGRRSATRTIREGFSKEVRFFITAGGADEPVLDRSVFRDQFVRGILGAADVDDDDFITDVELGQFLVNAVYDERGAPHRPRWGWLTDARYDKGVWAIPVPGSFRTASSPGLGAGAHAYFANDLDAALDIWSRYAFAGDVRVMKHLGDMYSGAPLEELGLIEPVWHLYPDFSLDHAQALAFYAQVIIRYIAREKLDVFDSNDRLLRRSMQAFTQLRATSSTDDVRRANELTAQYFESGSPTDLYSFGISLLIGMPLAYDFTQGMGYMRLAADRNVPAALRDFNMRSALLTDRERKAIDSFIGGWEPPLPAEYNGKTEQQGELERLRKELEEVRRAEALAAVSDIDIDIIQRLLRSLGYYDGPIDNIASPAMRQGVRRFQSALGAPTTGYLTLLQTVALVEQSAATGYPMGEYVLGVMYVRGIGVVQDGALAIIWLMAAADSDLAIAHYALGVVYRDGTTGQNAVPPDLEQAAKHFAKAAALGYTPAERALADLRLDAAPGVE